MKKFEEQKSSEQEKDEASIELLRQLTRKLCSGDISTAKLAAFNLSWMQEDGLAILTETLLGNYSRTTKKTAAYGLRSMKGRMKKIALEVLQKGLKHHDTSTREICRNALQLLGQKEPKETVPKKPLTSRTRFSIISDSSADVKQFAEFLGELAELYCELSNGDELVIRDGRIPSRKLAGSCVHA